MSNETRVTLTQVSATDIVSLSDKIQDHWGQTGQLPDKEKLCEILQEAGVEWDMRNLSVHPRDPEYAFWKQMGEEVDPTLVVEQPEAVCRSINNKQKHHEVPLQETP